MSFIQGGAGPDSLLGDTVTPGDADTILGYGDSDTLRGLLGDDSLGGGYGADSLFGGGGNDTLVGDYGSTLSNDGNDTLFGDAGNDLLSGNGGADILNGGANNDTLVGGLGLDTLTGGTGADLFTLGGSQSTYGVYDGEIDRITDFSVADGDRIDVSSLGISEFGTLQQFITDLGADAGITVLHNGLATGLLLAGLANHLTLTAANFVFNTTVSNDAVTGSAGDDDLFGGLGNDFVQGLGGTDRLFGSSGADTLYGFTGSDSLVGGDGADSLFGDYSGNFYGDGTDTLSGGAGDDSLGGGGGADILNGGADNDTLTGGIGLDTLTGGTGADLFTLAGSQGAYGVYDGEIDRINDFLTADHDRIDVSSLGISEFASLQQFITDLGADFGISVLHNGLATGVRVANGPVLRAADFVFSTAVSNDVVGGSNAADDLFGGLGDDFIQGAGGTDRLFGEAGNDQLNGGNDADTLFGGAGNDTLYGAYGSDSLTGGDGADSLFGEYNGSTYGEADTLSGGAGTDSLHGGGGADMLDGGADADTLVGGLGLDTLTGGTGADLFILGGNQGAYGVYGSEIDRIADFSVADGDRIDVSSLGISEFASLQQFIADLGTDAGVTVLHNGLATGVRLAGLANPATLTAAQFVFSTAVSNDVIGGSNAADDLFGGLGDDFVQGAGGTDRLFGEAGNDQLNGGNDADTLFGGAGVDTLYGDYGSDSLVGGDGADVLFGDYNGNFTNDSADTLSGGAGADVLHGGGGGDVLDGGADADTLSGFAGADTLTGGTGADLFRLAGDAAVPVTYAGEIDRITDFSVAEGDRIDVSMLGISEFGTLQQFIADLGTDAGITILRGGFANGLRLAGLANPATLTAAQFVFSTTVSDDFIVGSSYADDLFGGLGTDSLFGGTADDRLFGEAGNDSLYGNYGADSLSGGAGNDTLFGDYAGSYVNDGADVLTGGLGADSLIGGGGNDTLTGGEGNDTLTGGSGTDRAVFSGAWRDYTITGSVAAGFTLTDTRAGSPDGTDSVSGVESFAFSNGTFAAALLVNDAPVAANDTNAADAVTEAGGTANATAGDPTAAGNLHGNDSDADAALGDVLAVIGIRTGTEAAGGAFTAVAGAQTVTGTYGTLLVNADGSYVYTLNNADPDTEALAAGQVVTDVFTYRSTDLKGLIDIAQLTISITGTNDAPVITSNGGGTSAALSIAENTTAVTTVTATDVEPGSVLTYSIVGGADAALFQIDAATGVLRFITAPDFDLPGDAGANNVYDVRVRVSDGTHADLQDLAVSVTNVNEAPVITSNGGGAAAAISVAERVTAVTTVQAADPDAGSTITYAITGGADAALFIINAATGALRFRAAPNFEIPTDAGGDGIYNVQVRASDGTLSDLQDIAVTVTDVNEAPRITSGGGGTSAALSMQENRTAVTRVLAADPDAGAVLTYSIAGGDDRARFTIDAATGQLSFRAGPNFEAPTDLNGDNVYEVIVRVSDGSLVDNQTILVTVTDSATGVTVEGTAAADLINPTRTPTGQPLPTDEGDRIFGRDGNDTLSGGGGVDTLNGGLGDDSFLVDANDIVVEAAGEGEDTILTSDGRVMEASVERLTLQGTASVDVTGNVLGNRIVGNDGNNRLSGLSGLDSLFGGAGDDSLEGGAHRDNLTGGAGADRFIFTSGSGNDTVTDFDGLAGPGGDALDFTAFGITLADLTISSAAGGASTRIMVTATGESVLLVGVAFGTLDTANDILL